MGILEDVANEKSEDIYNYLRQPVETQWHGTYFYVMKGTLKYGFGHKDWLANEVYEKGTGVEYNTYARIRGYYCDGNDVVNVYNFNEKMTAKYPLLVYADEWFRVYDQDLKVIYESTGGVELYTIKNSQLPRSDRGGVSIDTIRGATPWVVGRATSAVGGIRRSEADLHSGTSSYHTYDFYRDRSNQQESYDCHLIGFGIYRVES